MSNSKFHIQILEQGWLENCLPEEDLCSHGLITLVVGGITVVNGEQDYGISESALALLRTLEKDHTNAHPIAERMVFHGCGTILMMGCPIGVDWELRHVNGTIRIRNIVRYDSTDESQIIKFPDLEVEVPFHQYRQEVIAFAKEAQEPFQGAEKNIPDDFGREMYTDFWEEYNSLLQKYDSEG